MAPHLIADAIVTAQDAADEIQSAKSALLGLRRWSSPYRKEGRPTRQAVLVRRGPEARQRAVVLLT
jgi:hypothetical protein